MNRSLGVLLSLLFGSTLISALIFMPTAVLFAADEAPPLPGQTALSALKWWDAQWRYRLPITIEAGGYARLDKPVDVAINFTDLLTALGVGGTVDRNSLYLHEVDSSGNIITTNNPFQFDPPAKPDSPGSLTILMKGTTAANARRYYHLYFDVQGTGPFTPQPVTPLVSVTDNVMDAGLVSYQIQTNEATYYYHKEGGGFSSLLDKNGNDWISYSTAVGSAGDFRGIPNMVFPSDGGYFHPGRTGVVSSLLSKGPLKVVIQSQTADKAWQTLWEIYPDYARLKVLKAATNYWFLYEGTPGGVLEVGSDFIVRPDGTQTLAGNSWKGDLSPEWLFFSDPVVNRSLFFAHHEDDNIVDSYFPMNSEMTVFGFGRDGTSRLLSQVPSHFTLGFEDGVGLAATRSAIQAAYKDVSITVGLPESQAPYALVINKQGNGQVTVDPDKAEYAYGEEAVLKAIASPGWIFSGWTGFLTGVNPNPTIVFKSDIQITAIFKETHELAINVDGAGTVTLDPDKAFYVDGEEIALEATANAGWVFKEWTGDLTGTNPKKTIVIKDDMQITAVFEQDQYALTIATDGAGQVMVDPLKSAYLYKDKVALEAIADTGWTFKEWQGDLTGADNKSTIEITGDMQITAVFDQDQYNLTIEQTGKGSVSKAPDQAFYLYGEVVELEATPEKGWIFSGWEGDISGEDEKVSLAMTGDFTVHALFREPKYYIPAIFSQGEG